MSPQALTRAGKFGYRVTVQSDGRTLFEEIKEKQMVPAKPAPEKTATVGLSLTIGQSTEFAREKVECAAWCTLPSLPDEESIADTYEVCSQHVERTIREKLDEATVKFFPHLVPQT